MGLTTWKTPSKTWFYHRKVILQQMDVYSWTEFVSGNEMSLVQTNNLLRILIFYQLKP